MFKVGIGEFQLWTHFYFVLVFVNKFEYVFGCSSLLFIDSFPSEEIFKKFFTIFYKV